MEGVEDKGGDVAGYMPLQRQVGFIYDSPNLFVIAHELGHGAFNLRHTFSPESFIAAERTTQNLMDYNGGTELWKHQWEFIRDPQNIWFAWAQEEGEGEAKTQNLVELLQERILLNLKDNQERFQKYAYSNQSILSSITDFDMTYNGGGKYINGRLIIGNGTKYNKSNEDIISTIYHEYLHYLNDLYQVYPYRMEDKSSGRIYSKLVACYERRLQNQEEFLQSAYLSYLTYLLNTPNQSTKAYDMPDTYKELSEKEMIVFNTYIQNKGISPEEVCFPYQYTPSNYSKDELNAHKETLKANDLKVFKMGEIKITFYNSEIERYERKKEKSEKYEAENNINSDGYEN